MNQSINYTIDGRVYTIHNPVGNSATYKITSNRMEIGYVCIGEVNEFTGENIWCGTNLESNELARELGAFIEEENI
jgi:hypothetical protein